jgi:hypothetical protein
MVMTTVTMALFLLALFYDLPSPVEDGYCGTLTDEMSCLTKRTVLDPNVHKCIWNKPVINDADAMIAMVTLSSSLTGVVLARDPVDADESVHLQYCELNTNTDSSRAFVVTFLLTSLFSMFINSGLDVLFDILLAYPPSKLTVRRRSSFHATVPFEEEVDVKHHTESSSFLSRRILVSESIAATRSV